MKLPPKRKPALQSSSQGDRVARRAGVAHLALGNDGQANLSLRGIGSAQTLVLVDGKRLMPADGRGSVDLNLLPPMMIEAVDVMTGGAVAFVVESLDPGFRAGDTVEGLLGWQEFAVIPGRAESRFALIHVSDLARIIADAGGGAG